MAGDESEFATCYCCGLTEECTPEYVSAVRGRYGGRWICGLCSEAVGDEVRRSTATISTEEALDRHVSFCKEILPSQHPPAIETFIAAVRQILRRSLGTPRGAHQQRKLGRAGSCLPALAGR